VLTLLRCRDPLGDLAAVGSRQLTDQPKGEAMPSTKVLTQLLVAVLAAVVIHLGQDTAWLGYLPGWLAPLLGPVIGALAAYFKAETRPAPSSFNQ